MNLRLHLSSHARSHHAFLPSYQFYTLVILFTGCILLHHAGAQTPSISDMSDLITASPSTSPSSSSSNDMVASSIDFMADFSSNSGLLPFPTPSQTSTSLMPSSSQMTEPVLSSSSTSESLETSIPPSPPSSMVPMISSMVVLMPSSPVLVPSPSSAVEMVMVSTEDVMMSTVAVTSVAVTSVAVTSVAVTSDLESMLTTSSEDTTTGTTAPPPPPPTTASPPAAAFPVAVVAGAAAGGGIFLLILLVTFFCCCYCCCCRSSSKKEYATGNEGRPWVVVRTYTQNVERHGSIISRGSRGSFARSSITSIASSLRRLSGKRRSKTKDKDTHYVNEDAVAMKVTPL